MFNLSSRSLFIGADLICYIGKSIEKSSLRRYWWDGYHKTCLNVSLPLTGNIAVYIFVSPFSILSRHADLAADLALDSR